MILLSFLLIFHSATFYAFNILKDYIAAFSFLIKSKSAGSHSTLSKVSFVNHLAASCSLSISLPDFILHKKHFIVKWKWG